MEVIAGAKSSLVATSISCWREKAVRCKGKEERGRFGRFGKLVGKVSGIAVDFLSGNFFVIFR